MNYRPWLDGEALRQMGGLPPDAFDVLIRTMARICENPYDRLISMAVRDEAPQERMAELGDAGFIGGSDPGRHGVPADLFGAALGR